ncbi:MAG TPA: hypothetical protein VHM70_06890 [Polyangiaceae bacterium]|nr:hypothetical protein [Polyangiaceae bacterium]
MSGPRDRAGTPTTGMNPAHNARARACEVRPEHLSSLEPIHRLLAGMSDPYEATSRIAPLVEQIPVLLARCERRLLRSSPYAEWNSTAHLLTLIGNGGLESELLTLLEDLTQLKGESPSDEK